MTREQFIAKIAEPLCEAAGLPTHTAQLVKDIAELAYIEGHAEGRRSGLADAQKLVEATA